MEEYLHDKPYHLAHFCNDGHAMMYAVEFNVKWRDKINTGPLPNEYVDYSHPYRKRLKVGMKCKGCGELTIHYNTICCCPLHPQCEVDEKNTD